MKPKKPPVVSHCKECGRTVIGKRRYRARVYCDECKPPGGRPGNHTQRCAMPGCDEDLPNNATYCRHHARNLAAARRARKRHPRQLVLRPDYLLLKLGTVSMKTEA